jgi:hypothetical protein
MGNYSCGCKTTADVWLKCNLHASAPKMLAALKDAEKAIMSLDADALGIGRSSGGAYRWPLRNELLSKIGQAIARVELP